MNNRSKSISSKASGKKPVRKQKAMKSGKSRKSGEVSYAPLARTKVMRTTVPNVSGSAYSGDGRMRVRHREYISDISGSVAFAASGLSINPGDSRTFPWLSVLAAEFESYLFRSLKFEFETQKSASTNGSVMMAVDFDAADDPPVNKQQLMAYHNAVRSAVWDECCYSSALHDLEKFGVQRYVRLGALPANLDIKTYDVGNLFVATQGEADTTPVGELYVEYDVELITPQIASGVAAYNSVHISSPSATLANPFAGSVNTGGLQVSGSGNTLTFDRVGQYLVALNWDGTTPTAVAPTITGTVTVSDPYGGQFVAVSLLGGADLFLVQVTDVGQTMIFDFSASAASINNMDTRIAFYGFANS
jgi:hypothetical protein